MNQQALITDNITEVLTKIIEFTSSRQKILTENINNVHNFGFIPKDLAVGEFSDLLDSAIDEHIRNKRLVLCDFEKRYLRPGWTLRGAACHRQLRPETPRRKQG